MAALSYEGENPYGISGTLWSTLQKDYLSDEKNYTWNELNLSLQKHWGEKFTASFGLYNLLDKKIDALYIHGRAWFAGIEMNGRSPMGKRSILRTFPSEPGPQLGPIAIPAACTVRNFLKKYLTE